MGLLGSAVIGISTVAPVYCLTSTLGPTVGEVGVQMPAVFLAGFLPMLLVAFAYRELNNAVPDCGTSFTWTVKAFGPRVGWMCGWGLVIATIIVLSNLAYVATSFFYLLLGELTGSPAVAALDDNKAAHVLTCLVFIAAATAISYRGMTATKGVQYTLVGLQLAVLAVFVALAVIKAQSGDSMRLHRLLLDLARPVRRPVVLRLHGRAVAVDLHVLGLGHLPHGQRGDRRRARRRPAAPPCWPWSC